MTVSIEADRNRALLRWYEAQGRDLPWRLTTDPYPILVSEVMLQQTQVDRVVRHFTRFMARFPTVEALSAAQFADVLRVWSGLGYNSRARRLLDAARVIAAKGWPTDVDGLGQLPGVGPYTAAAVASFALGERVAAVDTNSRRVLSRWHGEPLKGAGLDAAAAADLDEDAASWNQAVMDLGATICLPRAPRCDVCPVSTWCAGPDVYEPPRPQPRFDGSLRQIRGAVVRALVAGTSTLDDLVDTTGFAKPAVAKALDGLSQDGLVTAEGATYRLTQ